MPSDDRREPGLHCASTLAVAVTLFVPSLAVTVIVALPLLVCVIEMSSSHWLIVAMGLSSVTVKVSSASVSWPK